jgi:hypothetical protein
MNLSIKRKFLLLTVMSFGLILSGCAEPPANWGYDTLEFIPSGGRGALAAAIGSATNTIYVAVRDMNDAGIIAALEAAASKQVTVKLLVDADYKAGLTGISSAVSTNFGNTYGNMDDNFFIIDGMIYLLSSSDIASDQFVLFRMTDRDMLYSFESEFNQMFRDGRFAYGSDTYEKKLPINQVQGYYIHDNWVELYFQPTDSILAHIRARLGQTYESIEGNLRELDQSGLALLLNDVMNSCPGSTLDFAPGAVVKLSNYAYLLTNGGRVLDTAFDFNMIFVDIDTDYRTLIFTTFDLMDDTSILRNDGTCLIISGPVVKDIYNAVAAKTSGAGVSNVTITPPVYKSPVVLHDVVFSEILWKGIKLSGADLDYGPCFIELKNVSTQYVNIGGFRVIITNYNVQTEPNMFSIPYGTVLEPGGHYTIASSTKVFSVYDFYWQWIFINHTGFTMVLQDGLGNNIDRAADVFTDPGDYYGGQGIPMVRDLTLPIGDGALTTEWNAAVTMKNYYPTYASYGNLGTPGDD